jgi:hypothetical protein
LMMWVERRLGGGCGAAWRRTSALGVGTCEAISFAFYGPLDEVHLSRCLVGTGKLRSIGSLRCAASNKREAMRLVCC